MIQRRIKLYSLGVLDSPSDVNTADKFGLTPLMRAARAGGAPVVRALLGSGARVDAHDADGRTALMYAASGGHTRVARLLIARGANVNARGRHGFLTPLLCAVHSARPSRRHPWQMDVSLGIFNE